LVRLRQNGGVNTQAAGFLSKYPKVNPFNHRNRSHAQARSGDGIEPAFPVNAVSSSDLILR
jgi:hypothetical protein